LVAGRGPEKQLWSGGRHIRSEKHTTTMPVGEEGDKKSSRKGGATLGVPALVAVRQEEEDCWEALSMDEKKGVGKKK